MNNYFAKNLKYLREKNNYDQQKVAEDLKVPQPTLSCWENGLRTPKIEQILDIAEYFNVDMDIVSRDYSMQNNNQDFTELDQILFSKTKDLTDAEKRTVINIVDAIKKDIDREI